MKIIVNPHSLELQKQQMLILENIIYKIQSSNFQEYEGLTKMAVFSNEDDSFTTMITNESCIIPVKFYKLMEQQDLGFMDIQVNGDNLIKRYQSKTSIL